MPYSRRTMTNPHPAKSALDLMNEFNTDTDDELESSPESAKEDFASMLSDSFKNVGRRFKVGDKVKGKLLNVGSEDLFVAIGAQNDAVIARRDLMDAEGKMIAQAGDVLDLYVTLVKKGEIRLSKNATDRNMAEDLTTAFQSNMAIQGRIVEVCKGGVRVNIKGKVAFCPISQIDSKHIENAEEYVGKSFDFKITEISEGGKNVVVSRRKLLDAEREIGTTSFLSEKQDGDIVTGRVTRFEPFGAFIELAPGVDGLVHISEIAHSRIGNPAEVLTLGQDVTVKILKREVLNGRAKISLSIRAVTPKEDRAVTASTDEAAPTKKDDPWQKLSVGQTFTGKVNRKEVYGLFVQLEPGITGLLHQSRVRETKGFQFDKIRVNDPLEVQILEIRLGERQISLGLPGDAGEDDWKSYKQEDANAGLGTLAAAFAKKK
jgi:small subunit ribosomal protein S1